MPEPLRQADESPSQAEPAPAPLDRPTYCIGCGYDLRGRKGGAEDRCPECGIDLAFMHVAPAPLPWECREARGRIRTYLATIWTMLMLGLSPWRVSEFRVIATYGAAQRFRWITIGSATIGVVATIFTMTSHEFGSRAGSGFDWARLAVITVWAIGWLILWSGLPTYLVEGRRIRPEERNHAIALLYYCTAPLCLLGPSGIGYLLLARADTFMYLSTPVLILFGLCLLSLLVAIVANSCLVIGVLVTVEPHNALSIALRMAGWIAVVAASAIGPVLWFPVGVFVAAAIYSLF